MEPQPQADRRARLLCRRGSELGAFLARTDILVSLLPLTPETRGLIDRKLIGQLAKDGPLGGPVLINAGRGERRSKAISLPHSMPANSSAPLSMCSKPSPCRLTARFGGIPKVTVTPHMAADSDPETICRYVLGQIDRIEQGLPPENVDRPGH
jgi:glyoxylate/hydroxypyruvate reductase